MKKQNNVKHLFELFSLLLYWAKISQFYGFAAISPRSDKIFSIVDRNKANPLS